MSSTELAVRPEDRATLATLFPGVTPRELIEAATDAANELHAVIQQKRLFQRIRTRDHVLVEGWQTCGTLVGVFAIRDGDDGAGGVRELPWPDLAPLPEPPPDPGPEPHRNAAAWAPWEQATARRERWERHEALIASRAMGRAYGFSVAYRSVKNGSPVGWGEGRCTRDEPNWANRYDFQLSSMAQTRGQSRALRQPLGFIVSLAGYATTPAEEVSPTAEPPETVVEAVPVLDEAATREVATTLQQRWPNLDGHGFMAVLAKRLGGTVPEPAGVALRAWAWWAGRSPEAALETPQEPPEQPSGPPTEETEETES